MTIHAITAVIVTAMIVPRAAIFIARGAELYPDTTRTGINVHLRQSRRRSGGDERACGDKTKCESFHCDLLFLVSLCLLELKTLQ
jgi:hypothetical protein